MRSTSDTLFQPISVLVADSSQLQSQLLVGALRRRPEFKVSACEAEAASLVHELHKTPFSVCLLNPTQCDDMCFTLIRRIRAEAPHMPVVLLIESYDHELVIGAVRSGVRGIFCLDESPLRSLCKCIHSVARGEPWFSHQQVLELLDVVSQVPSLRVVNDRGRTLLTPREEQVVALVAEGMSNRDVSRELSLSEHTIKKYLFRIFDKVGVSNRVELVLYAVNHSETRTAEWVPGIPA